MIQNNMKKHNKEIDDRLHPSFPEERLPRNYKELLNHNSYSYSC